MAFAVAKSTEATTPKRGKHSGRMATMDAPERSSVTAISGVLAGPAMISSFMSLLVMGDRDAARPVMVS